MTFTRFLSVGVTCLASMGCSLILNEDARQCSTDADCADRGFSGSTCDVAAGVCVARRGSNPDASVPDLPTGDAGVEETDGGGGSASASGGAASAGGTPQSMGGSPPVTTPPAPTGMRVVATSLTQTQGTFISTAYTDVCPADQVLVGLNVWTNTMPTWLERGQAVCGTLELSAAGSGYSVNVTGTAALPERGTGQATDAIQELRCAAGEVAVGFDGRSGSHVDRLRLYCAPLRAVDGPMGLQVELGDVLPRDGAGDVSGGSPFNYLTCPPRQVARGALLEAGASLDAFGMVCGRPVVTYPVGAACTTSDTCTTANCDGDTCRAATCDAPPGCECVLFDTSAYAFCDAQDRARNAELACQRAGLQLVSIDNGVENGWLRATATARGMDALVIGATDTDMEGQWVRSDGVQFWQGADAMNGGMAVAGGFAPWQSGQPDDAGNNGQDCAHQQTDSLWTDESCFAQAASVCEMP